MAPALPVRPPVRPMLARLARVLPEGDRFWYEPKWDGFRCLAFCSGDGVDLRSRHDRPLSRYFPEIIEALRDLPEPAVLDGELLTFVDDRPDFSALLARLHPARSRVERLSNETPARYVAFDLLARNGDDLRSSPFERRRAALEEVTQDLPATVRITPGTVDPASASEWLGASTPGIDGVVVKGLDAAYAEGRRTMTKVKRERTADCVVAGIRVLGDGGEVGSLLLALYDDDRLRHVGVCSSFGVHQRWELTATLAPLVTPLAGHPWEHGFGLEGGPLGRLKGTAGRWTPDLEQDWIPIAPRLVCEVTYDHVEGIRFRHPARFRRWRPDRDPRSCTLDQLQEAAAIGGGKR